MDSLAALMQTDNQELAQVPADPITPNVLTWQALGAAWRTGGFFNILVAWFNGPKPTRLGRIACGPSFGGRFVGFWNNARDDMKWAWDTGVTMARYVLVFIVLAAFINCTRGGDVGFRDCFSILVLVWFIGRALGVLDTTA
ncbi:hypothetical protein K458DRAFT_389818 [Lentithecium fluviatile CBS 122367]|uniref:Uncharacterized protein n=1 Tax=Lentithecium fluviatile CBS 122367 TaxID=1168545 RepID=A0A6G1J052_9PLEO|nr:hypothetical protein K458DRAFT_389818 [Lentithecium fluviatile CBS 122367]